MHTSRRVFIQKLTGSALVLSAMPGTLVAGCANSSSAENAVLRVAILGLGDYATRVANAMRSCQKAKLVGAISGTPAKLPVWQSRYNIQSRNCYNYQTLEQIKDNPDIDAVYVITPNATHKDFVIRAAKAGKQVICEKPMAVSPEQAQEMVDACKAAGVRLLVGYRMHFEPKTLEVIRMRKAGEFGKIRFFQGLSGFVSGDPHQWRRDPKLSGGGALMDIGIYSVNGARYMVGEEPVWVTAQEVKTEPDRFVPGIDETIQFQLGFPSGAVASCLSTYNMNNLDRFFLDGSDGYAELLPATGYGPTKGRTNKGELTQPDVVHQTVQMDAMSDILLRGGTPVVPVDGGEAVKDMKIIASIYQAVKTGQKVML
ncbi:MAG TPA: Gfo/Idh/MocA family oxidoreductase [Puia sp.]|jgi:predicted dehydrogenase|nr:Gfo/Idh/MocA family oxidoreductase [Puia sp.]